MLQKPNLTFVTLKIKVMIPEQIGFLGGLWGSDVPSTDLTAENLLSYRVEMGQGVLGQTGGQTDRQMDSAVT